MSTKSIIRLSANPEGFGVNPNQLEATMFASELPVQHSHLYYSDSELGLFVGVWDTTGMVEAAGAYPCEEFMWLIEGEANIKSCRTGAIEKVKAGETFLIPKGYECQWHQYGYLRKFFFIYEKPGEALPEEPTHQGIVVLESSEPVSAGSSSGSFVLGDHQSHLQQEIHYRDSAGKFVVGTWACESFESTLAPYPYHQLACVQSGSLTLTDRDGVHYCFNSGDVFFVPEGVMCSGAASESVRLAFVTLTTA